MFKEPNDKPAGTTGYATEAFIVLWQLLHVWYSTKSPQDTTCFILAGDSHEKRKVSHETKRDLGNCFDYFLFLFPGGPRLYKAESGGLGRKGLRKRSSTSPRGEICSLATIRDRWEGGGGSRSEKRGSHLCEVKQLGVIKLSFAIGTIHSYRHELAPAAPAAPFLLSPFFMKTL